MRDAKALRPHHDTMAAVDKAGVTDRIRFMRAGLGTRRYHQRYTAEIDTVGKHSAGVAGFILLMYQPGLPPAELLAAAICHDLPEAVTGDIPSPAKRAWSDDAKASLEQLEWHLLDKHGFNYPLTEGWKRQLKMADIFDGTMFCIEELNRGNREIQTVGDTYLSYLHQQEWNTEREQLIARSLTTMWEELRYV